MPLYQIKIVIREDKAEEFVESLRSLVRVFQKERGSLAYGMYTDVEKENTCCIVGEWKTVRHMERHFQTRHFEVLLGAAAILGETFQIAIAGEVEKGGFELAKSKIALGSP